MNWLERRKIDRSAWPLADLCAGEPDHKLWATKAGFPGAAIRNQGSGAWCGYIAVPPGHPWHGMAPDDCDVHGGITFTAGRRLDTDPSASEPRLPNAELDAWVIGFDGSHDGDVRPAWDNDIAGSEYRTLGYVCSEVESLARQAKAAEENGR